MGAERVTPSFFSFFLAEPFEGLKLPKNFGRSDISKYAPSGEVVGKGGRRERQRIAWTDLTRYACPAAAAAATVLCDGRHPSRSAHALNVIRRGKKKRAEKNRESQVLVERGRALLANKTHTATAPPLTSPISRGHDDGLEVTRSISSPPSSFTRLRRAPSNASPRVERCCCLFYFGVGKRLR